MKKLLCLIGVVVFAATASADNKLINPGFEDTPWDNGWTSGVDYDGVLPQSSTEHHSGSKCCLIDEKCTTPDEIKYAWIYQTIQPLIACTVSVWYKYHLKVQGTPDHASIWIHVKKNGTWTTEWFKSISGSNVEDEVATWTCWGKRYTVNDTVSGIEFTARSYGEICGDTEFWVDDAYMDGTPVGSAPGAVSWATPDHSNTTASITWNWNAATGATSYEVSYNGGAWTDVGNVLTYTKSSLSVNTQHSLNVRGKNAYGTGTAAGTNSKYTSATTLTTPTHSNQTTSGMRLGWSCTAAKDYMYGTTTSCTDGPTTNTYIDVSGIGANTSVTRYVKARNGDNDLTDYLTLDPFYTSQNTPTGITFSGVTSSSITATASGTFPNLTSGSSGIFIRNSTNGTNSGWITTTSWTNSGLNPSTTYSYYAKARNGDGDETAETSPHNQATSGGVNNPPNTPSNPSPENGATGVNINADLHWLGGDPDGDPVTYDVYFGTSSPPPLVAADQSATTYDPGALANNTKYYWKIVAKDNHSATTTGPEWNFTTLTGAEGVILSVEPYTIYAPPPAVGGTFVDSIYITGITSAQPLCMWQFKLTFNPDVLQCDSAKYGQGHIFDGHPIASVPPEITSSSILYGCSLIGDDPGVTGSGRLCYIFWKVKSGSNSTLHFVNYPYDDTFLWDFNNDFILFTPADGYFKWSSVSIEETSLNEIIEPLLQCYPNPFGSKTVVRYGIPKGGKVSLKIYDISGQLIKTLVNETKEIGYYSTNLDTKGLSNGVYFCKLECNSEVLTQKLVLVK